ncbi:short chain dehydrogenase [Venturia nashicola]|nr:short chain dehydrogenase [Venturia nashicola]
MKRSSATFHSLPTFQSPIRLQLACPEISFFSLKNQTILITGAGRGLGIELALGVVENGGHVAALDILDTPSNEWAQLQKIAKQRNVTVSYRKADITDEEDFKSAVAEISSRGRAINAPLQGAIACAGIQQKIPTLDYPVADFERMMRVNTVGSFITAKAVANDMVANKVQGSIVLIASMSGSIANRGLTCSAYNTSKAAVHQLCRSMAQEIGVHGIRINTLSPGYIRTAMTDALLAAEPEVEKTWMAGALLGRLGAPEDFKAPAVFLLSRGSSFMTGADLRVDGGHTAAV